MSSKVFYTRLILIALGVGGLLFLLNSLAGVQEVGLFMHVVHLFFIVLTILIFEIGSRLAIAEDKNSFSRFTLLVMLVKMVLCVLILLVYKKLVEPTNNFFLIPFFLIYLTYTIFEVVIMMRISKIQKIENG